MNTYDIVFIVIMIFTLIGVFSYRLKDYKTEEDWKKILKQNQWTANSYGDPKRFDVHTQIPYEDEKEIQKETKVVRPLQTPQNGMGTKV